MKLVLPLHWLYWSIHTKDESKRGSAFAFIFGVNWLVQWMSCNDKFHGIRACQWGVIPDDCQLLTPVFRQTGWPRLKAVSIDFQNGANRAHGFSQYYWYLVSFAWLMLRHIFNFRFLSCYHGNGNQLRLALSCSINKLFYRPIHCVSAQYTTDIWDD